jgi:predicted permease
MIRRSPAFYLLAVLIMGLGIGASIAMFSLFDAVFLKPLAFRDADRLVMVWEEALHLGSPRMDVAPANYLDWKEQSKAFEDLAAYLGNAFNMIDGGEPERLDGIQATPNLFSMLGVRPALGRWFDSKEGLPGQAPVTILSYGLWERRFGGDPNIIGRSIRIDDQSYQVVGVMPEGFQFPRGDTQLWMPIQFARTESGPGGRNVHFLKVAGRLRQGASWEQAESEVRTISSRLAEVYPATNKNYSAVVFPLRQEFVRDTRTSLWLLLAAGQLVLLIACANVASMLVTRGLGRTHEIGVRAALGASRWRIARQLVVEGLALSVCGTIAGILAATAVFRFLQRLIPASLAGSVAPSIDGRLLLLGVAVSVLTGVVFGLAPLRAVFRLDLIHTFRGRSIAASHGRGRSVMVGLEMALAIVVVACTGLVVRTILNIQNQNPGFHQDNVLTLRLELTSARYKTVQSRITFYNTVLDHVHALPGVISAGFTTFLPYRNLGGTSGLFVEGSSSQVPLLYRREISPDYLATIGVPLRRGRSFTDQDDANHPPVVIITEGAAKYFDGDPLGQRIGLGTATGPWATVIGIAGDIREEGPELPSQRATVYAPYAQTTSAWFFNPRDLAIHVRGEPLSLADAVKREIRSVDSAQTISQLSTLDGIVDEQVSNRKLQAILLSAFSITALVLAGLGVYALLSFAVRARQREFGVRMALGAQSGDIVSSIFRETFFSLALGSLAGLAMVVIVSRSVASLLYGVTPTDPVALGSSVVLLFAVAFLAAALPAWRSTQIDPLIALRDE